MQNLYVPGKCETPIAKTTSVSNARTNRPTVRVVFVCNALIILSATTPTTCV